MKEALAREMLEESLRLAREMEAKDRLCSVLLAHDFARARCGQCGNDFLIAFSCRGRGVCPACNARRMVATAAHLTDRVLPDISLRQWVLAVPKRLRYFLEHDAELQGAALRLFLRAAEQCLRAHNSGSGHAARLGAVAFIHRFGSSLNAHLHFHCVVIDGVFDAAAGGSSSVPPPGWVRPPSPRCSCAYGGGFSVDGSARIAAADRDGRERLLLYCARPSLAFGRLREPDPERVFYESN